MLTEGQQRLYDAPCRQVLKILCAQLLTENLLIICTKACAAVGLQALLIDLDRIAKAAIFAELAVRHGLHHADGGHEGVIERVG